MKYELVIEEGTQLKRIKAIRDIPKYRVKTGDFGGYIASESNLSQANDAWVFDDAVVSGDARVFGDARVSGNAWVSGNAKVSDDARVFGDARVSGIVWVSDDAWVFGNARVFGSARVSGNARVFGNARVSDDSWVSGNAYVSLGKYICCIGVADGWWKSLVNVNGAAYIQAGCRSFNLDDAYNYWSNHVKDRALTLALLESAKSIANLLGLTYR